MERQADPITVAPVLQKVQIAFKDFINKFQKDNIGELDYFATSSQQFLLTFILNLSLKEKYAVQVSCILSYYSNTQHLGQLSIYLAEAIPNDFIQNKLEYLQNQILPSIRDFLAGGQLQQSNSDFESDQQHPFNVRLNDDSLVLPSVKPCSYEDLTAFRNDFDKFTFDCCQIKNLNWNGYKNQAGVYLEKYARENANLLRVDSSLQEGKGDPLKKLWWLIYIVLAKYWLLTPAQCTCKVDELIIGIEKGINETEVDYNQIHAFEMDPSTENNQISHQQYHSQENLLQEENEIEYKMFNPETLKNLQTFAGSDSASFKNTLESCRFSEEFTPSHYFVLSACLMDGYNKVLAGKNKINIMQSFAHLQTQSREYNECNINWTTWWKNLKKLAAGSVTNDKSYLSMLTQYIQHNQNKEPFFSIHQQKTQSGHDLDQNLLILWRLALRYDKFEDLQNSLLFLSICAYFPRKEDLKIEDLKSQIENLERVQPLQIQAQLSKNSRKDNRLREHNGAGSDSQFLILLVDSQIHRHRWKKNEFADTRSARKIAAIMKVSTDDLFCIVFFMLNGHFKEQAVILAQQDMGYNRQQLAQYMRKLIWQYRSFTALLDAFRGYHTEYMKQYQNNEGLFFHTESQSNFFCSAEEGNQFQKNGFTYEVE